MLPISCQDCSPTLQGFDPDISHALSQQELEKELLELELKNSSDPHTHQACGCWDSNLLLMLLGAHAILPMQFFPAPFRLLQWLL